MSEINQIAKNSSSFPEIISMDEMNYRYVMYVVMLCKGNRSQACAELGVSIRTLRNWLNNWSHSKNIIIPTGDTDKFEENFLKFNGLKEREKIKENEIIQITEILITEFGFPLERVNGSEEDETKHPCLESPSLTSFIVYDN